jgi:hypothetical protein
MNELLIDNCFKIPCHLAKVEEVNWLLNYIMRKHKSTNILSAFMN